MNNISQFKFSNDNSQHEDCKYLGIKNISLLHPHIDTFALSVFLCTFLYAKNLHIVHDF